MGTTEPRRGASRSTVAATEAAVAEGLEAVSEWDRDPAAPPAIAAPPRPPARHPATLAPRAADRLPAPRKVRVLGGTSPPSSERLVSSVTSIALISSRERTGLDLTGDSVLRNGEEPFIRDPPEAGCAGCAEGRPVVVNWEVEVIAEKNEG